MRVWQHILLIRGLKVKIRHIRSVRTKLTYPKNSTVQFIWRQTHKQTSEWLRNCERLFLSLCEKEKSKTWKLLFIYVFLGRGEGDRGREPLMSGCLSGTPYWGSGPQPRHVSWLGIEAATLWFPGRHSIHWATPARHKRVILRSMYIIQGFITLYLKGVKVSKSLQMKSTNFIVFTQKDEVLSDILL